MDLSEIGRQFGLNEAQTRAAVEALTPVVAAGMRRNGPSAGGLEDIIRSITQGGAPEETDAATSQGNDILGQIFGSKEVSRGVANELSATSGIGSSILKKMLPIIASIVMAQVAKQMGSRGGSSGGGLGDILGDILGGSRNPAPQPKSTGGIEDILKDILGGGSGGTAAPRSSPRSGNAADDLLRSVEESLRRR
ncbi:MAG: DUF937 domain-containing protein [Rhizobiales bacterium]|jgi:hypothetical protein|nr:DUF937 domain-containing protein [Hyphomicrobiales bacterium]